MRPHLPRGEHHGHLHFAACRSTGAPTRTVATHGARRHATILLRRGVTRQHPAAQSSVTVGENTATPSERLPTSEQAPARDFWDE